MSRSGRPFAAIVASGLAVILLLLAGSVWSQVIYDYFSYLPLVAHQGTPTPTPTKTPTPTSWIYCRLRGKVMAAVTPAVPINGAVVSYTHLSYVVPGHTGITLTNASGQYVFAPFDTHDTDSIKIEAQAEGYTSEVHASNAIYMCIYGGYSNFALIPWTPTPTPTPTPPSPARAAP